MQPTDVTTLTVTTEEMPAIAPAETTGNGFVMVAILLVIFIFAATALLGVYITHEPHGKHKRRR